AGGLFRFTGLRAVGTEKGDLLLDGRARVAGPWNDFDVGSDVDGVAGLDLRGRRDLDVEPGHGGVCREGAAVLGLVLVADLLRGLGLLGGVVVRDAGQRADRRPGGCARAAILAAAGERPDRGADSAGDERVAVARECIGRGCTATLLRRASC